MKKVILTATLLVVFTLTALSQSKNDHDKRFACPNEAKDTLFVVKEMYSIMNSLWNSPMWRNEKPVIISVKTIDPYAIRLGVSVESTMKK